MTLVEGRVRFLEESKEATPIKVTESQEEDSKEEVGSVVARKSPRTLMSEEKKQVEGLGEQAEANALVAAILLEEKGRKDPAPISSSLPSYSSTITDMGTVTNVTTTDDFISRIRDRFKETTDLLEATKSAPAWAKSEDIGEQQDSPVSVMGHMGAVTAF